MKIYWKFIAFTFLLSTSISSCLIDDLASIPYGYHELVTIDKTTEFNFQSLEYSGDGMIHQNECELRTNLNNSSIDPIEICLLEGSYLEIKKGLTYEMHWEIKEGDEIISNTFSGSFSYGEGYLLLQQELANHSNIQMRVDYTDDEIIYAPSSSARLIFQRE